MKREHATATKADHADRSAADRSQKSNTGPGLAADVLALHSQIGNNGVARLLQAKLRVSQPDDPLEREADRVAEQVMRMPGAAGPGATGHPYSGSPPPPADTGGSIPPNMNAALSDGGSPLPDSARAFFEPRFARDFSAVRVHTGPRAAASADQLEARAFTVGQDIAFGQGEFDTSGASGRGLLAHELTHTIQQAGGAIQAQRQSLPRGQHGTGGRSPVGQASQIDMEAHLAHSDKFFALGMVIKAGQPLSVYRAILRRAESGNESIVSLAVAAVTAGPSYPRVVPIPSQGRDLLIWGSPAREAVLGMLARALRQWALDHWQEPRFLEQDPVSVASYLMEYGGYKEMLRWADAQPLSHEYIDRNELLGGEVLASFGEAVGMGLLIIGLVGLFVGAEIITAGQATWLLVGYAGHQGIQSYLERREEIERKGYDVPIPETALASAGDVAGVSQIIEGMTGERLGTGEQLGSVARSQQLGGGAGSVTALLLGSRAYRKGQGLGRTLRLSLPPRTPAGPYGAIAEPGTAVEQPTVPERNPNPGPVEQSVRSRLSAEDQIGLDLFIEKIKAGGRDPEVAFARIPEAILEVQVRKAAEGYRARVEQAEEAGARSALAEGDPLRPQVRHHEWRDNIRIHYENTPPHASEIAQAQEVARLTGEQVHLFGDLPGRVTYPGIDGTIGSPPRPLSLKSAAPEWARWHAQEGLAKAREHGYSKVTVYIRVRGSLADALAHWNEPPPKGKTGPTFRTGIVAEILLQADDVGMSMEPPLGPPLAPPAHTRPDPDRE